MEGSSGCWVETAFLRALGPAGWQGCGRDSQSRRGKLPAGCVQETDSIRGSVGRGGDPGRQGA